MVEMEWSEAEPGSGGLGFTHSSGVSAGQPRYPSGRPRLNVKLARTG